jgi:cyclopropane-fatty-acyl-phospholipid synthase
MTSEPRLQPISLPDTRARRVFERLLNGSGVTLNGDAPQDLHIFHPDVFSRILHQGTLGLGESYMDGWWDCDRIDDLAYRLLRNGLGVRAKPPHERLLYRLQAGFFNLQSKARATIVGEAHYDLGNDLFERMLDGTMCYSCAYWKEARTLHQAQVASSTWHAESSTCRPA